MGPVLLATLNTHTHTHTERVADRLNRCWVKPFQREQVWGSESSGLTQAVRSCCRVVPTVPGLKVQDGSCSVGPFQTWPPEFQHLVTSHFLCCTFRIFNPLNWWIYDQLIKLDYLATLKHVVRFMRLNHKWNDKFLILHFFIYLLKLTSAFNHNGFQITFDYPE